MTNQCKVKDQCKVTNQCKVTKSMHSNKPMQIKFMINVKGESNTVALVAGILTR